MSQAPDAPPGPLAPWVGAHWLRAHLDDVVVADVRWSLDEGARREAYLDGHLPGAVFVDLDRDLSAQPGGTRGRHPLPEPERFAASMSRLGIADEDTVIAYDDAGGAIAARLVWMLRVTEHRAAVLDGGMAAWGGALERGEVTRQARSFTPRPWPRAATADADEGEAIASGATSGLVVDARDPERYRGDSEPVDPRPGHVPGAVNLAYAGNLTEGDRLLTEADLRARFAELRDVGDLVVYCGSGVTACHDLLAMEQVGIHARLFAGSWSAWSADPSRPAATGPDPR